MASGPGALQFQVNKNAGSTGIFWQREKQKNDARKFGYKSRQLRHPIRQPDKEEELIRLEVAKEAEKKKFNKANKDFIRQNKHRYKPKAETEAPPPGTTHIKPGTVTLTQEQLAALLASLGKTSDKEDNPLRISIDPKTNKIEVEKFESDDEDSGRYRNNDESNDADDDASEVGIAAFLNEDHKKKEKKKETDSRRSRPSRERKPSEMEVPQSSKSPDQAQNTLRPEPPPETRLSWNDAKKEAGVAHVPDLVPWKHLTVGERKRLQWARERAEVAENYNPWGRPGAGAPTKEQENKKSPQKAANDNWSNPSPREANVEAVKKKKQEELATEIAQLQMEIRAAERKKKEEEAKLEAESREGKKTKSEEGKKEVDNKKRLQEETKRRRERKEKKEEDKKDGGQDDQNQATEEEVLSKKELERRKWLAELDKQREEQRMKKQQEKDRERAGIHDQWADRFVYHKTLENISPRHQAQASRQQSNPLGSSREDVDVSEPPPAAMRSSMVVGAGTLNDRRYDDKKAEEKRKWLQELENQREEQRIKKAAQKARDREEDGTWADRYPTDHQKLHRPAPGTDANASSQMAADSLAKSNHSSLQRTNSAPMPPAQTDNLNSLNTAEEPTSFLRGQGAFIDPLSRREAEEKRKRELEYQAQVKAQIEEKERQKREERERKRREDMEEERKLQMERENMNRQAEMEQKKLREKEEMRQRQINELKSAMDEAQEKAAEEKSIRRIHHLQQLGHDVTQLKATYEEPPPMSRMSVALPAAPGNNRGGGEATTPRIKQYEASSIPGLGSDSHRPDNPPQHQQQHPAREPSPPIHALAEFNNRPQQRERNPMSYSKDPYVEDRVLTPSRFRNPSRPRDDPDSPRREFGTQTLDLKDLKELLAKLPEDVQIEYKMRVEDALREKKEAKKVPARKVHVKSADDARKPSQKVAEREAGRGRGDQDKGKDKPERPLRPNERPAWNARKRKTILKNSERDPFYQQKKEEAEARRVKRERQLLYLQELNKEKFQNLSRSRDASPEGGPKQVQSRKSAPTNKTAPQGKRLAVGNVAGDASPNILSLINDGHKAEKSPQTTGRSSPPIPAVKHRTVRDQDADSDPYLYANSNFRNSQTDTRYGDASVLPTSDGDFVPFMRTTEILDPSKADEPFPVSRENSRMERARRAYYETHHPANKGRKMDVYQDREREAAFKASQQNPILNPSLVTDHPTGRQDMILQQLSSLKNTLMQRQRELEDYMTPAELEEQAGRS